MSESTGTQSKIALVTGGGTGIGRAIARGSRLPATGS